MVRQITKKQSSSGMNILFVYIQPINPIKGGTERVTYTVANALKKLGLQVYFLATHASSRDSLLYDSEKYILLSKELTNEDRKKLAPPRG